jgi:hypothetical protein
MNRHPALMPAAYRGNRTIAGPAIGSHRGRPLVGEPPKWEIA